MSDDGREDVNEIKERLVRIETLLTIKFDGVVARVDKLEDNQKWLVRSILGVIIAALVGLVVVSKR